jgi:hypothetical protein
MATATTVPAKAAMATAKAATGACITVRSGVGTLTFLRRAAAQEIHGDYRNEEYEGEDSSIVVVHAAIIPYFQRGCEGPSRPGLIQTET